MKPLQMLDHVMLWITRGVGALFVLLILGTFPFASDNGLIREWSAQFAMSVLLLVSLWCLRRDIARLFLGLTSVLLLFGSMMNTVWHWPEDLIGQLILDSALLSMLWVALRPPPSPPPHFWRSVFSPYEMPRHKNSVNSV
jgi:hypothetical protein